MKIKILKRPSTEPKFNDPTPSHKPQREGFLGKGFWSSPTARILLTVTIIGLGIFLRCFCLSADRPFNVSSGQPVNIEGQDIHDVNTDPDQYTSFARNKALWGSWDLFGHNLVLCLNSALTLISFLFFKLLGVGRWQANFVAACLSSLTLVFFYLAIKRGKDQKTALLATFFLGINYILVMYSRSTFSEIPVIFFIVLGVYLLVLGMKRGWLLIFSGACFACAIFFAKMLAMFILPVCLGVMVLSTSDQFPARYRKIKIPPTLLFVVGFLVVMVPWFLIIYYPSAKNISGWVYSMSVGLHGFPRGLHSVSDFIHSLFSFGGVAHVLVTKRYTSSTNLLGTNLFLRMPFLFILSMLFLSGLFFKIFKVKSILKNLKSCSRLELFFALWLVVGIFALMPWHYRPLRYQILLIPPMCTLAAFCLSDFLNRSQVEEKTKTSVFFWMFSIPVASLLTFHTISFFLKVFPGLASLNALIIFSFFLSLPLTYVFYVVKRRKPSSVKQSYRIIIVGVVVFFVAFINGGRFLAFARNLQYSLLRSSQDLGRILGQEAVISGTYSQTLVMENRLKLVLRMFHSWDEDPDFFLRHPVTHLALAAQGGQRKRAFIDYPEVMRNAKPVITYYLRNFPVQILRVAESSRNPKTKNYKLSNFEKARLLIEEDQIDSAIAMLNQFVSQYPRNFIGDITLAEIYYGRKDFAKAVLFLEKALRFDPTNFLAHQFLGKVYLDLYNQEGDDTYRLLAIEESKKASKLYPQNTALSTRLRKIRGY
ncbi:MAG: glycosyltransferase family 39 protein [candidate division Zixibacteria bacterium]|nr:glycosyltransferase family 39 protein [candidate division Zixibacteria bacterium]